MYLGHDGIIFRMNKGKEMENLDPVNEDGKLHQETSECNNKSGAPYVALRKGVKHQKTPSLLRAITRCFGCYFALTGLCKLAADVISFTSPPILRFVSENTFRIQFLLLTLRNLTYFSRPTYVNSRRHTVFDLNFP